MRVTMSRAICFHSMAMLFSCAPAKKVAYFQDIPESIRLNPLSLTTASFTDPVIGSNDLLQIIVQTPEKPASIIPGTTGSGSAGSYTSPLYSEYLVDKEGNIEMPLAGRIAVKGLTTWAIRDSVRHRMERYLNGPIVSVRLINFSVTVLGEVSKPGSYLMTSEKGSVLDALGMAGDLTIYGKRENVLLIRTSNEKKFALRLDLNSAKIIQSPYFYLRQGDVIYVEPDKSKIASLDAAKTRNYALLASGLSVMIVLISRFNF
jgi:polysaccharide biosynthesis/export protein